jgi:hypothetical protein
MATVRMGVLSSLYRWEIIVQTYTSEWQEDYGKSHVARGAAI